MGSTGRVYADAARVSLFRLALPLLVFLIGLAGVTALDDGIYFWGNVATAVLGGVQLVGPVAAGLAVWSAGLSRRQATAWLPRMSSRDAVAARAPGVVADLWWAGAAQAVVSTAMVGWAALQGASGNPLEGVAAVPVAVLGLLVHVALGWLVGRLAPSRWAAPLLAVAAFVYIGWNIDHQGAWYYLLAPVMSQKFDVFSGVSPVLLAEQLAWYLLLTVLLLLLWALAIQRRPWVVTAALAVGAVAVVPAVLLGSGSGAGHLLQDEEPASLACEVRRTVKVCVHPAMRRGLGPLAEGLTAVAARVEETPAQIDWLVQRPRPSRAATPAGATAFHADDLGAGYVREAVDELAQDIVSPIACGEQSSGENRFGSLVVAAWMAGRLDQLPRGDFLSARLAGMLDAVEARSPAEQRAWFRRHYDDAVNCRLMVADVAGG